MIRDQPLQLDTQKELMMAVRTVMMKFTTFLMVSFFMIFSI